MTLNFAEPNHHQQHTLSSNSNRQFSCQLLEIRFPYRPGLELGHHRLWSLHKPMKFTDFEETKASPAQPIHFKHPGNNRQQANETATTPAPSMTSTCLENLRCLWETKRPPVFSPTSGATGTHHSSPLYYYAECVYLVELIYSGSRWLRCGCCATRPANRQFPPYNTELTSSAYLFSRLR